jgi:hypothetical protein
MILYSQGKKKNTKKKKFKISPGGKKQDQEDLGLHI